MSKQSHRLLLAAIVVATFVPLLTTARWFESFDCVEYIQHARSWWPRAGEPFAPILHEKRLPFFPIVIALANRLVPDPALAAKLLTRACGSALVVACFALVAELFGATTGLVAALLVASCPLGLFLAGVIHPLPLFTLFMVVATHAVVRHVKSGWTAPLVAANLIVAVACFTRPEGFAFVPPLLWLDARAVRRAGAGGRLALALGVVAQAGSALFFMRHFWYGSRIVNTARSGNFVGHFLEWSAGYLRLLPSTCSYVAFVFVLVGAWHLFTRLRRGGLEPGQRTLVVAAAWVFVAIVGGISTFDNFVGAYVYSALPLALCVGAVGLERVVAAAGARAVLVRTLLLVAVLAVNVPFAIAKFKSFAGVLADEHACCLWLADHVGKDARGRQENVVASDPNHLAYWTGLAVANYSREAMEKRGKVRWVVLSDLILENFDHDFDAEVAWLCREKGAQVVFEAATDVRPIFATTYCHPYRWVYTPKILDVRFDLHHFRSAVLEIPK